MTDDFVMSIGPGNAFEGSDLEIRVRRGYVDEVVETLREAGFAAEEPIAHASGDPAGVKITVALLNAGGLAALATVLATIFARHDNKRLIVNMEGLDATGYTSGDLKQILHALYPDGRPPDDPQSRE